MKIKTEAKLTTFEAVCMIVGNSIGTGIIAVPYLATKNTIFGIAVTIVLAYVVNVILHLLIAELSYNNGGRQLVKSFERELFQGKKWISWIFFAVYGMAIMVGIVGNINGAAQILVSWMDIPIELAQLLYYIVVGSVVWMGVKAVGVAQKHMFFLFLVIVGIMSIATITHPMYFFGEASFHWNNLLAFYSMVVFATSANQAVIQVVKGLEGDAGKIRKTIFMGFGVSSLIVLVVTVTVLVGINGPIDREMAYMQLGQQFGLWGKVLAGAFSLFALLTTFWTNTLSLRDVVCEQIGTTPRISWLIATIPCIVMAVFGSKSFIALTRYMSGVVVLVGILLIFTYGKSRKKAGKSPICGKLGGLPWQIFILIATIFSAIGAIVPLT